VKARITDIACHLPPRVLDNEDLAREIEGWTAQKILEKTGIRRRHIAAEGECSSDLAVEAARRLFASGACSPADVDFLLLCTQSPDYFLPTTACLLQERLGIPTSAGALDFNLGCSGFVYGLALAKGLVETGQARAVLLLTAETYSKFLAKDDRSVRTLFGDAAAATLVKAGEEEEDAIGPFEFGTDGAGAENLIVPTGGLRRPREPDAPLVTDSSGNRRTVNDLSMNGPEIFSFTLRVVPPTVERLLAKAGKSAADVDLYVFHQANRYMLEHLRKKMKLPEDRFVISVEACGNTVSASIPFALADAAAAGRLKRGGLVMLVGFGVGYSWGGALIRWDARALPPPESQAP
jgi:3-oxoacyl-[acyl-carrier-protein] synthase-3